MNLRSYINWMQRFTIYETENDIYVVASDASENYFRIMKISRLPADIRDPSSHPTLTSETACDAEWRLDIQNDSRIYTGKELALLLQSIKAKSLVKGFSKDADSESTAYEVSRSSTQPEGLPPPVRNYQPLTKSHTAFGLIGFIRFLNGFYLIIITQRREAARIGEHRIYKIDETKMVYIPGDIPISSSRESRYSRNKKLAVVNTSEETRYLKMFQGIELSRNFYFSYTYDLTRSLQKNMEPLELSGDVPDVTQDLVAFRSIPDSRFLWNYPLVPPFFQSNSIGVSNWFVGLIHGFVKQTYLVSCGMPISIALVARRSRFFAGTRFLKRGVNIDGNVANEVETEQIVCDTAEPRLSRMRVSSLVQHRGSVPLFWSQDTARLVVGKPPIAITWEDPYFEAFGMHFADLIERYGAPVIILNLLKKKEKRRFEQQLTDGFLAGVKYLNQFPPTLRSPEPRSSETPPIVYMDFDMAHIKRSRNILALDDLKKIAEECLQRTGLYFSGGMLNTAFTRQEYIHRTRLHMGSNLCPRQQGIVRTSCVDCLDRTNTAQFVLGHVAVTYQLLAMGLLTQPHLSFDSAVSRLLKDLYEEHGDALALQYGGSGVVHTIGAYQNPSTSRVTSRDIMQTLSRYYSNNFVDFEKQLATDLFLRVFRPGAGPLVLPPEGERRRPEDAALVAAAVSARSGRAFLLSSEPSHEAHMHWLQAWATLPPFRASLSAWFPLAPFFARQRALEGWGIWTADDTNATGDDKELEEVLQTSFQLLNLTTNDPGGDWFLELYQPHGWTHFYDLTYHQLPLATKESTSDSAKARVGRSHADLVPQSQLARVVQLRAGQLFSPPSALEEIGKVANSSRNTLSNAMSSISQAPIAAASNSLCSSSVVNIGEDENTSDSSHNSDSPFTISKYLRRRATAGVSDNRSHQPSLVTKTPSSTSHSGPSPFLGKFEQVRLSELNSGMWGVATTTAEITEEHHPDLKPRNGRNDLWLKKSLSSNIPRRFSLCSASSFIKLRKPSDEDMERYRKYASIPLTVICAPLPDVLTIDQISMKIYESTYELFRTGKCSISADSLSIYKNYQI